MKPKGRKSDDKRKSCLQCSPKTSSPRTMELRNAKRKITSVTFKQKAEVFTPSPSKRKSKRITVKSIINKEQSVRVEAKADESDVSVNIDSTDDESNDVKRRKKSFSSADEDETRDDQISDSDSEESVENEGKNGIGDSLALDLSDMDDSCDDLGHEPPAKRRKMSPAPKEKTRKEKVIESAQLELNKNLFVYRDKLTFVVLNHPASITLNGIYGLEVLSGSLSVLGHNLNSSSGIVETFTIGNVYTFKIETKCGDEIWKKPANLQSFKQRLISMVNDSSFMNMIMKTCKNDSVIIHLSTARTHRLHEFIHKYHPLKIFGRSGCVTELDIETLIKPESPLPSSPQPIEFNETYEDLYVEIDQSICQAKIDQVRGPVILIYGAPSTGKSVLMQFLINRILSDHDKVYCLDADSEKPEFTPPGCISLVELTQPIFGPAFTHLIPAKKMIFLGSIGPDYSLGMTINAFTQAYHSYLEENPSGPLLINTMGYQRGFCKMHVNRMVQCVVPKYVIKVINANAEDEEDVEIPHSNPFETKYRTFGTNLPAAVLTAKNVRAKLHQELMLVSYFANCQPRCEINSTLNFVQPYCVPLKNIAIGTPIKHDPCNLAAAINAGYVALCCLHPDLLEDNGEMWPKQVKQHITPNSLTKRENVVTECVGFGIVRGIHHDESYLYIITPVPHHTLYGVNSLIKSNIQLPKSLLVNQNTYNYLLPYVHEIHPFDEQDNLMIQDSNRSKVKDSEADMGLEVFDLQAYGAVYNHLRNTHKSAQDDAKATKLAMQRITTSSDTSTTTITTTTKAGELTPMTTYVTESNRPGGVFANGLYNNDQYSPQYMQYAQPGPFYAGQPVARPVYTSQTNTAKAADDDDDELQIDCIRLVNAPPWPNSGRMEQAREQPQPVAVEEDERPQEDVNQSKELKESMEVEPEMKDEVEADDYDSAGDEEGEEEEEEEEGEEQEDDDEEEGEEDEEDEDEEGEEEEEGEEDEEEDDECEEDEERESGAEDDAEVEQIEENGENEEEKQDNLETSETTERSDDAEEQKQDEEEQLDYEDDAD